MAFVLDNGELAALPPLVQLPGGDHRAADVPAAVNEVAGDPVQLMDPGKDLLPAGQESGIGPVVRDQQGEGRPLALVVERRTWLP